MAPHSSGIPGVFPQGRGTWWEHLCGTWWKQLSLLKMDVLSLEQLTILDRDFLGETPIEVSKSSVEALGETGTWNRSSQMPLLLPSVYSFVVELCDFSPHISPAYIGFGETGTSRS